MLSSLDTAEGRRAVNKVYSCVAFHQGFTYSKPKQTPKKLKYFLKKIKIFTWLVRVARRDININVRRKCTDPQDGPEWIQTQ